MNGEFFSRRGSEGAPILRLAADEDLNRDILRALLRRRPDLEIIGVTEERLSGIDDPSVLACAAREGRVLLSHDVTTLAG